MPQIANGDSGAAARALINSVLPRTVAFATTPPLDGNAVMAAQTIAGALVFTAPPSPVIGAQCYVRLTADGANAPAFSGFVEHNSSAGYLNTAGIVNLVRFWHDGVTSWFAVAQALNVVPFVMQAAAIANTMPTQIVVTFDRDMNQAITPPVGAFTVATTSGGSAATDAVTAAAWIDARTLRLTKSRVTLAADTVTLGYAPPGSNALVDLSGNLAGARAGLAVANGVAAVSTATPLRLGGLTAMQETANGDGTYAYRATANGGWNDGSGAGTTSASLAANTDGYVEAQLNGNANNFGPLLGFQTATSTTAYTSMTYGIGVNGTVKKFGAGSDGYGDASTQPVGGAGANGWLRLQRTGTVMKARYSADGTTYVDLYTYPNASTEKLYVAVVIGTSDAANTILRVRGSNVA